MRIRSRHPRTAAISAKNPFAGMWRRPWGVIEPPSHLHREVVEADSRDWVVISDDVGVVSMVRKR